jgi:hypothetical protein
LPSWRLPFLSFYPAFLCFRQWAKAFNSFQGRPGFGLFSPCAFGLAPASEICNFGSLALKRQLSQAGFRLVPASPIKLIGCYMVKPHG